MTRVAMLAVLVIVVDGDRHVVPRSLTCLRTAAGQPVEAHLRGDGVFADGFESGSVARWRNPPGPCDG